MLGRDGRGQANPSTRENHAENLWMIGIVNESDYGRFMVVNNNLGNVPDHIPGSNALAFNVSQMYFKQ